MNDIQKLRYWTFKILPLVYDDSLSYYETLAKVTSKLNEVIGNVNEIPNEIKEQLDSDALANKVMQNLAKAIATDEGEATFTATAKDGGELIWLNGVLYEVGAPMTVGTNYVVGSNINEVVLEDILNHMKGYLSDKNEFYAERSSHDYDTGVYLYWKDNLYITTADIKINDILYDGGDSQNLKEVNLGDEISSHYLEMHDADNNLQTQIDENENDIETKMAEEISRATEAEETLTKNLDTEINRATARENNIDSRISNIVSQSGDDNTEIVDARLGNEIEGSQQYSTLGDAIRNQTKQSMMQGTFILEENKPIYVGFRLAKGHTYYVSSTDTVNNLTLAGCDGSVNEQLNRIDYWNNSPLNTQGSTFACSETTNFLVLWSAHPGVISIVDNTQESNKTIRLQANETKDVYIPSSNTYISSTQPVTITKNDTTLVTNQLVNVYFTASSRNTDHYVLTNNSDSQVNLISFKETMTVSHSLPLNSLTLFRRDDYIPIRFYNASTATITVDGVELPKSENTVYYPTIVPYNISIITTNSYTGWTPIQQPANYRNRSIGTTLNTSLLATDVNTLQTVEAGTEYNDYAHLAFSNITTIKVAAQDTPDYYKKQADIVINSEDAEPILSLLSTSQVSLDILLMPGNYYLKSYRNVNGHKVVIPGTTNTYSSGFGEAINITIRGLYTARTSQRGGTNLIIDQSLHEQATDGMTIIGYHTEDGVKHNRMNTNFTLKNFNIIGYGYDMPITYIDTTPCQTTLIENVNIHSWKEKVNTYDAFNDTPNENCVGIRVGRGSNYGILNHVKNLNIWYCYKGLVCNGEHFIFEDVKMHHDVYGFYFGDRLTVGRMEHPNIFLGCSIEGCKVLGSLNHKSDETYIPRKTLIMIGTSTETSWAIPVNERTEETGNSTATLPIEVNSEYYRGRLELDFYKDPVSNPDSSHFDRTWYSGQNVYHASANNV